MNDEVKTTYGIIGYPLGHTLSPVMHNAAFKALGVDAVYKAMELPHEELEPFFLGLRKNDCPIFGLNVTVPYKEVAIKFVDTITPLAQKLNAINTIIINEERRLIGYNTDAPGFMSHMVELGFNTKGKRIAVLGAGGSARAIIGTLCMIPDRPESIKIYNRTSSRLDALLEDLGSRIDLSIVESVMSIDDLNLELADMLINTTSVGLKAEDPVLVEPELLNSNMLVYDLIYNPKETPLLQIARERGAQTANGLGMLFYQGVLAFQHWANTQLDDEVKAVMRATLEEALI